MDFEKKYPLTHRSNEHVLVQWTRGYKQVDVYYKENLIGSVTGAAKLKNGTSFLSELGEIKLKLSEQPITLDVIVGGYHSPVNVSHPAKELKRSANFFWIIAAFAIIGSLIEGVQVGIGAIGQIVISIDLVIIATYIIAAVGVGKSKPWAFFLGFSMYSLMTLLTLLTLLGGNFISIIIFVIRLVILYFLITNIKHATATAKHNNFSKLGANENLLDSKI